MIETLAAKSRLLRDAGFTYNFDRMVYVNRQTKKAFSVEFIEDHAPGDLEQCIREATNGEWRFYFKSPPPAAVRQELANVLR